MIAISAASCHLWHVVRADLPRLVRGRDLRVELGRSRLLRFRRRRGGDDGAKVGVPFAEGAAHAPLGEEQPARRLLRIWLLAGPTANSTDLDEAAVHVRDLR